MKVLVTGGAGFIGSHIVDALIGAGHDVVVIDDLFTGHEKNVNPKARFYKLDIRDAALFDLFAVEKFDIVSHQAARGNVRASMADPMIYADVNVRGGINLLECCRKFGTKKSIYSSTGGCVYGELQYLPAGEKHPIQPRDPYGASKASFELYLPVYAMNYGLHYTILRYPNVYGPRQDPFGEAGVVSIFIGQMLQGIQAIINGDGEQLRDYVYIADVVRANMLALTKGNGGIYNLGWGTGVSVNHIFRSLKTMTNYLLDEVHGPPKLGEVRNCYLDAGKVKRELGWNPLVTFDEGLRHTLDFFRPIFKRNKI
ncbi:NAD-dependent epimerase/dehydratase family protein [Candidatus Parcubacteria bacterium]|jgi:UDP-glucose 4-epimerase|nr:MAG: NAD-dependent epimerase/dehydratase family protein [Candidatus Parcubacteria bacterium]